MKSNLYFLEINGSCYAYINLLTQKDSLKTLPVSSGFFYNIVCKYFSYFFKVIENSNEFDLIECEKINSRFILINNTQDIFLTELHYEFEHD
jgi:hypothetical protein